MHSEPDRTCSRNLLSIALGLVFVIVAVLFACLFWTDEEDLLKCAYSSGGKQKQKQVTSQEPQLYPLIYNIPLLGSHIQ